MGETRNRGVRIHDAGRTMLLEAKSLKVSRTKVNGQYSQVSGWTYAEVSENCNVSESTVKRFFTKNYVDEESAISICQVLEVELDEVIDRLLSPKIGRSEGVKGEEGFAVNQLKIALRRLEGQIPTDIHNELYAKWVRNNYIDDFDLEMRWDPNDQSVVELSKQEILTSHWNEELIELARSLNGIYYAIHHIHFLEGERVILDDLRKALKAALPN